MRKKGSVFFLAIVIIGSLCCERASAELFESSGRTVGNSENFALIIKSPIQNEIINGSNVSLNFSVNDTGLLLSVRSISYMVGLDGEIQNQTQHTINNKTVGLLDETLMLYNLTEGEHTITVNATMNYNFYSISCGGPIDISENVSGSVDFFVHQENNNFTVGQPTGFSVITAILGVAIAVTIVVIGSIIWFKKAKSKQPSRG